MKYLFVLLFLAPITLLSQRNDLNYNCGYWEVLSIDTSAWVDKDTMFICDVAHEWVYKEPYLYNDGTTLAVYCPCGCGRPQLYIEERIC